MDKQQKKALSQWLKKQSIPAKRWLMFSVILGTISAILLISQAGLLAHILHQLIIEHADKATLLTSFILLVVIVPLRALCSWGREVTSYRGGELIRQQIRELLLQRLELLGPAYIKGKPAGTWATLLLEQVEEMQDFFSRYLPQVSLAGIIPLLILVTVFPINWAAGLILLLTAPLVPLFMALVGMGAADANKRNFTALQRLSGHFLDRLQGIATIKLFNRVDAETEHLTNVTTAFRKRTMEVLRLAFLSSAVLEFFTAISIAIVAVYFGFSLIHELNFGHYDSGVTLFTGLFILILAPEFYQPLRDLGTFYHAKAQAMGAAESIVEFLEAEVEYPQQGTEKLSQTATISIIADQFEVLSPQGTSLTQPLSFTISPQQHIAIVGSSGAGKTSLVNGLLGFLPYKGSLKINGQELRGLKATSWRQQVSWIGQNPKLLHGTIGENIALSQPELLKSANDREKVQQITKLAHAYEFIELLPQGLDHPVGDGSAGLSVGQAQRIALARALLQQGQCWILDEPTASLDANSERLITETIAQATKNTTTIMITHRLDQLKKQDLILVMDKGEIVQAGHFEQLSQTGRLAEMLQHQQGGDFDA
ncbi:cysteine/glutathione ABC transporter permease/ATP-binding protein CydD [Vibrio sp. SS-MA-C1-2]|uniref:heme ABC transporter permease/ATP-binding protein CydD n=1 Tax=Vibrio sp. SS-MA-C1-2 TaxID=2908646 RepID=UPI001F172EC2|nr:cysteine/glutathione ABC transporter permease/ATP-binding protein CydD [Vibrio sp. SS-MA-C1-2]UJF19887.1 cysteine/glutathione ABC transporter permease/ATP-binding protein CydD [Vibrio sp. SS-MA-C1-2]